MRWLLRAYPRAWRARYGAEFADLLRARGLRPADVVDILRGALDAQMRAGRPDMRKVAPWAALLAVDAALAWGNLHATDDVQPVVALLLLASFGYGFYSPRWCWLFALLLFAAIPASTSWAYATNYPVYGGHHPLYEELIALLPVALGAGTGAGARLILAVG